MLLLQAHCGSEHASLNAHIFAEDTTRSSRAISWSSVWLTAVTRFIRAMLLHLPFKVLHILIVLFHQMLRHVCIGVLEEVFPLGSGFFDLAEHVNASLILCSLGFVLFFAPHTLGNQVLLGASWISREATLLLLRLPGT